MPAQVLLAEEALPAVAHVPGRIRLPLRVHDGDGSWSWLGLRRESGYDCQAPAAVPQRDEGSPSLSIPSCRHTTSAESGDVDTGKSAGVIRKGYREPSPGVLFEFKARDVG
jgi:hypothetical protein